MRCYNFRTLLIKYFLCQSLILINYVYCFTQVDTVERYKSRDLVITMMEELCDEYVVLDIEDFNSNVINGCYVQFELTPFSEKNRRFINGKVDTIHLSSNSVEIDVTYKIPEGICEMDSLYVLEFYHKLKFPEEFTSTTSLLFITTREVLTNELLNSRKPFDKLKGAEFFIEKDNSIPKSILNCKTLEYLLIDLEKSGLTKKIMCDIKKLIRSSSFKSLNVSIRSFEGSVNKNRVLKLKRWSEKLDEFVLYE